MGSEAITILGLLVVFGLLIYGALRAYINSPNRNLEARTKLLESALLERITSSAEHEQSANAHSDLSWFYIRIIVQYRKKFGRIREDTAPDMTLEEIDNATEGRFR